MRNSLISLTLALAVVAGSVVLLRAQLPQPGMTEARVWINNRTREEAIPVTFLGADPKAPPVPVVVTGVASVSVNGLVEARATTARQAWEYRDATFPANQLAGSLTPLGNEGWEATGITTLPNGNVTVLLKRPR